MDIFALPAIQNNTLLIIYLKSLRRELYKTFWLDTEVL